MTLIYSRWIVILSRNNTRKQSINALFVLVSLFMSKKTGQTGFLSAPF